MITNQFLDELARLIAATQPNNFWWRTIQCRHVRKVGILRNEGEAVGLGEFPDSAVIGLLQDGKTNLV